MLKTKETQKPSKDKMDDLRKEFENIKKKANFRKVKLLYKSCCGCGCYDVEIERTVSEDSKLKDGDRVKNIIEGDKVKG